MRTSPPAVRYRIVVKGRLSDVLGSAFEGMDVDAANGRTALTGWFEDQAKLHGVLDRIRDFGIELISINPVGTAAIGTEEAER